MLPVSQSPIFQSVLLYDHWMTPKWSWALQGIKATIFEAQISFCFTQRPAVFEIHSCQKLEMQWQASTWYYTVKSALYAWSYHWGQNILVHLLYDNLFLRYKASKSRKWCQTDPENLTVKRNLHTSITPGVHTLVHFARQPAVFKNTFCEIHQMTPDWRRILNG